MISKRFTQQGRMFLRRGRFYATQAQQADVEAHSYLTGDKVGALTENTIGYVMSKKTREYPYANSLKCTQQKFCFSNKDVKKHSEALACGLVELNVRPGDTVAYIDENNGEHFITQLACSKIGANLVKWNQVKKAKDLDRLLQFHRPRILLLPSKKGNVNFLKMLQEVVPETVRRYDAGTSVTFRSTKYPFLKQILLLDQGIRKERVPEGVATYGDYMVYGPFGYYESPLRRLALHINSDFPALVLGNEKNIHGNQYKPQVYSHKNLLDTGKIVADLTGMQTGDRSLLTGHLDSAFGSVIASFSTFVSTSELVMPARTWPGAQEMLRLLRQEQATLLFATAKELQQIVDEPTIGEYELEMLRGVVAYGNVSADLSAAIKEKLGVKDVWALNGNSSVALLTIDGKPAPGVEIKITRDVDGKIVHKGTKGTIKARGPTIPTQFANEIGFMTNHDESGWVTIEEETAIMQEDGKVDLL